MPCQDCAEGTLKNQRINIIRLASFDECLLITILNLVDTTQSERKERSKK